MNMHEWIDGWVDGCMFMFVCIMYACVHSDTDTYE